MADNKDFWNSGQDDFWNRPVVDDDWLKGSDQPVSDDRLKGSNQSGADDWMKMPANNPYLEEEKQTAAPEKKKVHIHTIICLIFMTAAILIFAGSHFWIIGKRNNMAEAAVKPSFEQEEITGESFYFHENNEVFLEDCAYTVIEENTVLGFPQNQKLIAVYAEIKSDEFLDDAYAMKNVYVGFESDGNPIYKKSLKRTNILPFLIDLGFQRTAAFDSWGLGNGENNKGYFFFLVPAETTEIVFFTECDDRKEPYAKLQKIYYKKQVIQSASAEITAELTDREVY